MKNLRYLALSALLVGGLYSCKKDAVRESDQEQPSTEVPEVPVDYTKYVSIGNSLTFGYADGGTYKEAQENSFPLILANSLGTDMKQALLNDGGGTGHMYLAGMTPGGLPIIKKATPSDNLSTKFTDPINNLGVPGIRAVDMGLPGYGAVNPYMGRLVANENLAKTKYIDLVGAALSDATFATFWLGNNDVLGFASSGGAYGVEGKPSPAYRLDGLPEVNIFTLNYKIMTDLLMEKRAILANIPPVSTAPFFTTVGKQVYAGIVLDPNNPYKLDAKTAGMLNQIYQLAGYTPEGDSFFVEGQNFPVFLTGPAGGMVGRQLDIDMKGDNDFLLLTFSGKIAEMKTKGYGFINVFEYPNELEFLKQGAIVKAIDGALKGIDPLVAAGAGKFTIDQLVGAGKITQGQADALKAGLVALGFKQAQIDAMTLKQIQGALNAVKAKATNDLIAAAKAAGLNPADPGSAITASKRLANPITTEWVLDKEETVLVTKKTEELNMVIKNFASSNPNWILLDADKIMTDDILGKSNPYGFTADYISGQFFSLDGIHLTPKGYAYISLKMVQAMNTQWGQTLTEPDPNSFRGIKMGQ